VYKTGQTRTLTAWDTPVVKPGRKQMPHTCSQCAAEYNSERELRDHLGAAHRQFGQEQSSFAPNDQKEEMLAAPANQPAK
jgi:hypothetical protein